MESDSENGMDPNGPQSNDAARDPAAAPGQEAAEASSDAGASDEEMDAFTEDVDAPTGVDARVAALDRALEMERQRSSELLARLQRTAADFDNFRKRARRDSEEKVKYASEGLVEGLLDVVANFDRALTTLEEADESHATGVRMIHRQFLTILEKHGVLGIESVGTPFDPRNHEALAREERTDVEDGVIIEEFEKGWCLHDRVLRPAKVKVAVRVSGPGNGGSPSGDGGDGAGAPMDPAE